MSRVYDMFADGDVAGIASDGFYRRQPPPPPQPGPGPVKCPPLVPPLEPEKPCDGKKRDDKRGIDLFGGITTEDLLLIAILFLVLSREGFDNLELLIGVGVLAFAILNNRGA